MPVLMNIMNTETMIKIQTHAVSTIINFARGLINEEEEDETSANNGSKIMQIYS